MLVIVVLLNAFAVAGQRAGVKETIKTDGL
jgi:hypothetical protein